MDTGIDWIELRDFDSSAIPFALDTNGEWREVDEVPRGKACNCFCPACRGPVVARHGEVRIHHFAHHDRKECRRALEASLFGMAVTILRSGRLQLPGAGRRASLLYSLGWSGPTQKFGPKEWLVEPRAISTEGAAVNCAAIEDSMLDRADIVLSALNIEIHLISSRKPVQRLSNVSGGPNSMLGIDLRTYARLWWETCDSEKEARIAEAAKARGLMEDWLANQLSGRGWLWHRELESERGKLAAAVEAELQRMRENARREREQNERVHRIIRERAERDRRLEEERLKRFNAVMNRARVDADETDIQPPIPEQPQYTDSSDHLWEIPTELPGCESTSWIVTATKIQRGPLKVMRRASASDREAISNRLAANLGLYRHEKLGDWFFVGSGPGVVPANVRPFLREEDPWRPVRREDETCLKGAQVSQ